MGPVQRNKQKITSPYGPRKSIFHRGVDLRCYDRVRFKFQPFIATEDAIVLRVHRDGHDNGVIVLQPLYSNYDELKYIHVRIEDSPVRNMIGERIEEGQILGYSERRGDSSSHHCHFEAWVGGSHVDPTIYFDKIGVKYA